MGVISSDSACGEFFHCENSGECVDASQVCNFHTDCPLGEDEGFICGEFVIFNKSLNCEIVILENCRNSTGVPLHHLA